MANELTTLEYALLGLLGLGKASAYDIRKLFRDTPMMQFSSSPGSIYPALKRLETARLLLASEIQGERGKSKRLYRLSAKGKRRLTTWLVATPSIHDVRTDVRVLFLKFSLMEPHVERAGVLQYLDALERALEQYRAELESFETMFRAMPALHAELGAKHGMMTCESYLAWVRTARRTIEKRAPG